MKQVIYSFLLGLACLIGVYLPTFVLVSVLLKSGVLGSLDKSAAEIASVPFIILISTAIALVAMVFLARRRHSSLAAYGFKSAPLRQLAVALVLGLVFALGLKALSRILPLGAGPDMGDLKQWQVILFFWIAAPVQEEMIFRGLIQSVVQARNQHEFQVGLGNIKLPFAVLVSALLFAVVHIATVRLGASFGTALFTVGGAFVLGIVAGWLRSKSGSLLPAILVHVLFNILAG